MKNLFKFIVLLNAIISILASCIEKPTIPTGSPMMLTTAEIPNFPSSTKQLSFTVEITPHEVCPWSATAKFPLFYMNFGVSYFGLAIDCSSSWIITSSGFWHAQASVAGVSSANYNTIAFFFTVDLDAKEYRMEVQTVGRRNSGGQTITIPTGMAFDANTKFYFCADQTGASPKSCTISRLFFEYRYYKYPTSSFPVTHISGGEAALAAFYLLRDGPATSLASTGASASPGYFGDDASNPTSGTSPTWDTSNAFVNIIPGQFLTFPLPTFSPVPLSTSISFSIAAWIKIAELPSGYTNIFSMHAADGTQVGFRLQATAATRRIGLYFGSRAIATPGNINNPPVVITLDTWQLIGFTAGISSNYKITDTTIFIGTQWVHYSLDLISPPLDLSTATVIRVGGATDSFKGQVSFVRLMTPGGGYLKTTGNTCSPDIDIELGLEDFPLACSASTTLNPSDNTCYSTCPGSLKSILPFTGFPIPLCLTCPNNCASCDSTECLTCDTNYFKYNGNCVNSCPTKTYFTGSTCQSCPSHCDTCDSTKCLTCDTNYFLYQGGCVNPCPAKTYSDSTSCISCSSHCSQCDASGCNVCDNGYEADSSKQCVLKPPTSPPGTEESGSGSGSDSGISIGIIIAIILGSLLCFLLIILLIWRIQKKLRSRRTRKVNNLQNQSPVNLEIRSRASPMSEIKHLNP